MGFFGDYISCIEFWTKTPPIPWLSSLWWSVSEWDFLWYRDTKMKFWRWDHIVSKMGILFRRREINIGFLCMCYMSYNQISCIWWGFFILDWRFFLPFALDRSDDDWMYASVICYVTRILLSWTRTCVMLNTHVRQICVCVF